jgi:hypothetical protein
VSLIELLAGYGVASTKTAIAGAGIRREVILAIKAQLDGIISDAPRKFGIGLMDSLASEDFAWADEELLVVDPAAQFAPNRAITLSNVQLLIDYCTRVLGRTYSYEGRMDIASVQFADAVFSPETRAEMGAQNVADQIEAGVRLFVVHLPGHYIVVHVLESGVVAVHETMTTSVAITARFVSKLGELASPRSVSVRNGPQGGTIIGSEICGYISAHNAAWISMTHGSPPPFQQDELQCFYAILGRVAGLPAERSRRKGKQPMPV